ncbi:shewanella-like protein phosphatase [Shewanella abyssi]|uniref:shewanella-like protein phosphatase n=1 Tax=Shewanella abyssi TaxID=311789 RepID=UPI002010C3A4|nr:shewanella-like protein phosphatase [Shewanella abyssi]MCL1048801.1 shewanella-like protein phosphatase [Shewanella abyssi]
MNNIFRLSLLGLTLLSPFVIAEPVTEFDGPYVITPKHEQTIAYWVCDNKLKTTAVVSQQVSRPAHCGDLPEVMLSNDLKQVMPDTYSAIKKVVALSDVHGQYDVLITLLKNQNIIDSDGNWAFGEGHMVMTGDIFDRGHQVNEVLWFMYQLDQQAREAGGMVHLLMGNHEQMVLNGDLRYVHQRYDIAATLIDRPYDKLYGADTEIGQWLRSKNTIIKINDVLYMHGGISSEWITRELTLAKANSLYRQHIGTAKKTLKADDLLNFLFFGNGPTWYRGYFSEAFTETELDTILNYFAVKRIVVGHTSQERVLGLFHNKVIAVDSSIKNGQSGELLLIKDNDLTRGLYNGSRQTL